MASSQISRSVPLSFPGCCGPQAQCATRGPPLRARPLTTRQASPHATDRTVAPIRAFDAGLRPVQAASPLPGLLTATRTGLPPAGDDELTNAKKHHGLTSRCHLLLCWAHERSRLVSHNGGATVMVTPRCHFRDWPKSYWCSRRDDMPDRSMTRNQ